MTAESKSCLQSDFWKETASRSPGWLETSFRLLMGTCRRQMIGVGLGGGRGGMGGFQKQGMVRGLVRQVTCFRETQKSRN